MIDDNSIAATEADIAWLHKQVCMFHFGRGTCPTEKRIRRMVMRERQRGTLPFMVSVA